MKMLLLEFSFPNKYAKLSAEMTWILCRLFSLEHIYLKKKTAFNLLEGKITDKIQAFLCEFFPSAFPPYQDVLQITYLCDSFAPFGEGNPLERPESFSFWQHRAASAGCCGTTRVFYDLRRLNHYFFIRGKEDFELHSHFNWKLEWRRWEKCSHVLWINPAAAA